MLMTTQTIRYAHKLLDARTRGKPLAPLSASMPLSVADAYEIARIATDIRIAHGENPVGRKIGFANRKLHGMQGHAADAGAPSWSPLFDSTVRQVEGNHGVQSLAGALQPRLQPEIVFRLAAAPPPHADLDTLADCIEWMAHGIEIVVCPYQGHDFGIADAIAAFGLHGILLLGEPTSLPQAARHYLGSTLGAASVSLSRDDGDGEGYVLCAAGFGCDVLGNPVFALKRLQCLLATQPQSPPLAAGEIVCTGAWAEAAPVRPGQTWITAFSGVSLPGLTISFV